MSTNKKTPDLSKHIERMMDVGKRTDDVFTALNAIDTAKKIIEIAMDSLKEEAKENKKISTSDLLTFCQRINNAYLSYYPKFKEELGQNLKQAGLTLNDPKKIEKPAQNAVIEFLKERERLRKIGAEIDDESLANIFFALIRAHSREQNRISTPNKREYIDDSDEIAMLITQLDKEIRLYQDIMDLQNYLDTLNLSDKAKRRIEEILWGETRHNKDIHQKIEHLMFEIIIPISDEMRHRLWEAFNLNPEELSTKSRRINFQWWLGFIARNVSNIMENEKENLINKIKQMLATPEGQKTINDHAKSKGLLVEWLNERLKFRLKCYPAIALTHTDDEKVKKAVYHLLEVS